MSETFAKLIPWYERWWISLAASLYRIVYHQFPSSATCKATHLAHSAVHQKAGLFLRNKQIWNRSFILLKVSCLRGSAKHFKPYLWWWQFSPRASSSLRSLRASSLRSSFLSSISTLKLLVVSYQWVNSQAQSGSHRWLKKGQLKLTTNQCEIHSLSCR